VTTAKPRPAPPAAPATRTLTADKLAREAYVERLMLSGMSRTQVVRQLVAHGVSTSLVKRAFETIVSGWRASREESSASARFETIERLRRDLAEMRNPGQLRNRNGYPVFENVLGPDGRPIRKGGRNVKKPVMAPINWSAVRAHEALLADIEGTNAPIDVKVDVDATVRASILAVVGGLTIERTETLVAEQLELERRAGIAPGRI
jgi:hypothetical protein